MDDKRMIQVEFEDRVYRDEIHGHGFNKVANIVVSGYARKLDREEIVAAAGLDPEQVGVIRITQHIGLDQHGRVLRERLPADKKRMNSDRFMINGKKPRAFLEPRKGSEPVAFLSEGGDTVYYTEVDIGYEGLEIKGLVKGTLPPVDPSFSYSIMTCGELMPAPGYGMTALEFTIGTRKEIVWIDGESLGRLIRHEASKRARFDGKTYSTMGEPFNEDLTWQANRDRD
jgi:hypothetical protein